MGVAAVGKHHGGREAEADLQRLLREDPETGLVAAHQPRCPRFRVSFSHWTDSGFGFHLGRSDWLEYHHPALDWRRSTPPMGALQTAIDSLCGKSCRRN